MNSLTFFFFFELPDVQTRFQLVVDIPSPSPELSGNFLTLCGTFLFPAEKQENNSVSQRMVCVSPEAGISILGKCLQGSEALKGNGPVRLLKIPDKDYESLP